MQRIVLFRNSDYKITVTCPGIFLASANKTVPSHMDLPSPNLEHSFAIWIIKYFYTVLKMDVVSAMWLNL